VVRDTCAALELKPGVSQDRVTVVVDNGWVTLTGIVHWQLQKEEAEAAVRGVAGVVGVTNNVAVRPPVSASDIKQQITKAFERMVAHHVSHLEVAVDEGKVTLRGMVRAGFEKFEAERVVREIPGVTEVENRLTICALAEAMEKNREEMGGPTLVVR
jgi:osmotically-inducible protein OsmY